MNFSCFSNYHNIPKTRLSIHSKDYIHSFIPRHNNSLVYSKSKGSFLKLSTQNCKKITFFFRKNLLTIHTVLALQQCSFMCVATRIRTMIFGSLTYYQSEKSVGSNHHHDHHSQLVKQQYIVGCQYCYYYLYYQPFIYYINIIIPFLASS